MQEGQYLILLVVDCVSLTHGTHVFAVYAVKLNVILHMFMRALIKVSSHNLAGSFKIRSNIPFLKKMYNLLIKANDMEWVFSSC